MRKLLFFLLLVLLAAPATAAGSAFTLDSSWASSWTLSQAVTWERAMMDESVLFREHWATASPVTFVASGGIPIYFVPQSTVAAICGIPDALGCHTATPAIYVANNEGSQTYAASHEVLETEIDPNVNLSYDGLLVEVCDPASAAFEMDGVWVADFVYPRWYNLGTSGPWDPVGVVPGPQRVAPGGYDSNYPPAARDPLARRRLIAGVITDGWPALARDDRP